MRSPVRLGLCAAVVILVGFGTAADLHAQCASGGTVSNVNDCVPPKKGSTECQVEWAITPTPPIIPPSTVPTAKITCMDNDPTCDADTTPGQCTFLVGACVNVSDPRFTCTPTDVAAYILKHPSAKDATKSHKNSFGHANMLNLTTALNSVIPSATGNQCSAQTPFVVPLKKGIAKGTAKISLKSNDSAMATDSDTIKFTCLPNPNVANTVCASARQITSTSELIGGPLAMGQVGDWLIENDKARFIIRDIGREFSFTLTYGGHLIDADLQQKIGPSTLTPPYPAGRDSFQGITPLINISSSDNPTSIMVVNDGTAGGPAKIRTTGPDDLFDPIDPRVAIVGFSTSLSVPVSAVDVDLPVTISNDYTLNCGDDFLTMETTVHNNGGSDLDIYNGDFANGSGQLEQVGPGLGFGDIPIRLGDRGLTSAVIPPYSWDWFGFFGFGDSDERSYALIPAVTLETSSFSQSGVVVPAYGNNLLNVLLGADPNNHCNGGPNNHAVCTTDSECPSAACTGKEKGSLHVPAGGDATFKRWFAVSDNGMGRVLDDRTRLAARGELPAMATGWVQGIVTVGGTPVDGARVVINRADRPTSDAVTDVFETRDGGFFQGTLPKGQYNAAVKVPGHMYENGLSTPTQHAINVGGGTTVVNFDVPETGFVRVNVTDGVSALPLASKVSVVGIDPAPADGVGATTSEFISGTSTETAFMFGYDAHEKVVIFGLPQVHFTDLGGDTGTFALRPGDYQIVVSHGPRYSVFKQMITVVAGSEGSPQVVNATVVPVITTSGYISGDFHVHMLHSPDSVVSNQERIVTMLAEGVDYFVASDHDYVTDLTSDVAAVGATGKVKTALSQEITYFDSGHFGAYPFDPANLPDPTSHTGGALDWGDATAPVGGGYPSDGSYDLSPNDMALLAKGPPFNAVVVQANHFNSGTLGYMRIHGIDTTTVPPQSSVDPSKIRLDPSITNTWADELTALELWIENSRPQAALALGENLGDWFNLLNNWSSTPGHELLRKTATFDSDTHSTTIVQAGGPRNMIADNSGSIAAIDPVTVANHINEGRNIGTNGPFLQVSIVGDGGATASHAIGSSLLVPAALGTAAIHVDVQSPDWAEFDQIQIFVNNVPSCTTTSPNFVGSTKKLCPPVADYTLNKGTDFVVTTVPVNGANRLEAHVVKTLTGGSLPAGDAWVVVIVKGTDGVSKPLFPMAPPSIFRRACSGDPCRGCTTPGDCTPFFAGTCVDQNVTTADLADGNLGQCGVTSLAIANPLFIDRDGDGFYKGLSVP